MLRDGLRRARMRPAPEDRRIRLRAGAVVALACALLGVGLLGLEAVFAQDARWRPAASKGDVPKPPADPTAAKVYAVFDRHCASCHQSGKGNLSAPASDFGNILDLTTLAADGTRIRAGMPDASPLYTMLQAAPWHSVEASGKDIEITAGDLDVVREWITSLKPADACSDRKQVSREDVSRAIRTHLESAGSAASSSRFLTLSHVHNACATSAEMKAYRQAATIAINSLSWGLKPIMLAAIDPTETVFQIDLTAMGWDEGRWNRVVAANPYRSADDLAGAGAEGLVTARADWFVTAALSPPLYYDLLGLPDRLSTLTASLRVDPVADVATDKARRLGIKTSMVARGSRLLQRSAFANGAFWMTFEYAPTPGRPDVFETPAGPGSRGAARPDASLVMFALPSGFNAFYMTNGDGQRLNDMPLSVLRSPSHPGQRISAGARCLSCHSQGPLLAADELRARVTADANLPRDIRDKVLALAAPDDEARTLIAGDIDRAVRAQKAAAVEPGATLDGVDPVSALIEIYERDVTIEVLAGELGVTPDRVVDVAGKITGAAGDVIDRIVHGPVPRRNVEAAASALAAAVRTGVVPPLEQVPLGGDPVADDAPPRLVLKTGPTRFRPGDALTLTARAPETCYLTLINVDRTGRGTVVYPNDFVQNNLIEAGKELRVPADDAPYVFRLQDPGRETVIGICQTGNKNLAGVRHDFERQRFTELGDYKVFLSRLNLAEEPKPATKGAVPADQRARRRGRQTAAPGAQSTGATRGETQMRSAVTIEIAP